MHQDVMEAPPAGAGPPAGLEGRRWRAVAGYSWVTPGQDAAYPFRQMRDGGKTARQEPAGARLAARRLLLVTVKGNRVLGSAQVVPEVA